MKPKITLFTVLLSVCLFLPALVKANPAPGTVEGEVREVKTKNPVAYANIALVQKGTSKIIAGIITDENGHFSLKSIPYGEYELEISYLGYKKKKVGVELERKNNPLTVGEILLEPKAEQLDEVVVAEERLKGKQEVDRTVYDVNDQVRNASSDGIDLLKYIPGVSVDFQDNITLEGTGNILYRVDGITRDKEYIAQLHPGDINKVEVVTNPGVEYEADIQAVINIILKKKRRGGRASIALQAPSHSGYVMNDNASIEYGNDKFRVFLSDRLHAENFNAVQTTETRITTNGNQISLDQQGEGTAQWLNNSTNYGIDLFLNDKNTINLYGRYYIHRSNHLDYTQYGKQKLNGVLTDEYIMTMDELSDGRSLFNSLYYKHNFTGSKHYITSQLNYYDYQSFQDNEYHYKYTFLDEELEEPTIINRFENTNNNRDMFQWKNDYSRIIGNVRMKFGYWSYYQWYNNTFEADQLTARDFKFNELRQEAYVSGAGAWNKLNYSGGLRVAYSHSEIDSTATNDYLEWLPQVSLQYGLSKTSSLKFSARRRIDRPGMNQLNPFETMTDSLTLNKGNPDLDPQVLNRAELQYAINIKSNYIAPKIYVDYTSNSIQTNSRLTENGLSVIQPENVGKRYEYGLSLTTALSPFKWLKINMNASVFNTKIEGPEGYSDELPSWRANGAIIVSPWPEKQIGFMASAQYQGTTLHYKQKNRRDLLFFIGVDATIYKNLKGSAFVVPISGNFTYGAQERIDNNYYYNHVGEIELNYLFAAELSYKFSWGEKPKKLNRSTDFEQDGKGGTL